MRNLICLILVALSNANGEPISNIYKVPATEEMKPYAQFHVADALLRIRKDGRARIDYTLPKELTGASEVKIHAQGMISSSSENIELNGKFATFKCKAQSQFANCGAEYRDLPFLGDSAESQQERDRIKMQLASQFNDPTELAARQVLVDVFGHEAAGVFESLKVRRD